MGGDIPLGGTLLGAVAGLVAGKAALEEMSAWKQLVRECRKKLTGVAGARSGSGTTLEIHC